MVMLTMEDPLADDIRLHGSQQFSGSRKARSAGLTLGGRRTRLQTTAFRTLRAVAYTVVAIVAFGGIPMVCAFLYDAGALALVFAH
jgi:hypothetical protein